MASICDVNVSCSATTDEVDIAGLLVLAGFKDEAPYR